MDLLCGYRRRHLTKDYSLSERNLGSSLGQEAIRRPPPCPACSSGAPCRSRRRRSRQPRRARPLGGRSEPPKQKKTPNSSLNTISLPARLSRPKQDGPSLSSTKNSVKTRCVRRLLNQGEIFSGNKRWKGH